MGSSGMGIAQMLQGTRLSAFMHGRLEPFQQRRLPLRSI